MCKRESPIFLILNSWGMETPSGIDSKIKTGLSIKILGWADPGCGKKKTAMRMAKRMSFFFIISRFLLKN